MSTSKKDTLFSLLTDLSRVAAGKGRYEFTDSFTHKRYSNLTNELIKRIIELFEEEENKIE